MTQRMTGGEAIVSGLLAHGVDTVFGLPGAQLYGLFDAFAKAAPRLKVIGARHEQTCGYMAFGAARATGKPQVCAVVPGPGMLNASAAMLTAYGANAPVLMLTGQIHEKFLGRERGALHEMRDQLSVMRGFTKWAARIEHPSEAPLMIARAFQEMTSGRPGPVALEASWDFFTAPAAVPEAFVLPPFPAPAPDPDAVQRAAAILNAAKAPMIFTGGGAQHAGREIETLAGRIGAAVVPFRSGKGAVGDDTPLAALMSAGQRLWPETDVAVVIGSRFELLDMRWRWAPPGLKIIRIDIDAAEMRRLPCDAAIVADAADGAAALAALAESPRDLERRMRRVAMAKAEAADAIEMVQPQVSYLRAIREALPREGFLTDEISQMGFASWWGFPVYTPRSFITAGYQGTLGSGFPTALGVKAAFPDRPVVAMTGDGGFMFAAQELATAAQYGLNVVTLVFNNSAFGNVRRDQTQAFEGRRIGCDLVNPDFATFAEAFGVRYWRAENPNALKAAIGEALEADAPALIEIPGDIDAESDPWPFIHPDFAR